MQSNNMILVEIGVNEEVASRAEVEANLERSFT